MMDQRKIGIFIATCRKEKELTQEQLGELLGVTNKSISKWENGKSLPDPSLYKPLCDILEINLIELFDGERIAEDKVVEKADQVIVGLVEDSHKYHTVHLIAKICSYLFTILGITLIFLPSLVSITQAEMLISISIGLFLLLSSMSIKFYFWGKSHDKKIQYEGIGFCSGLTLLLVALKLTGNIDWSWLWVLSPIWGCACLLVLIIVILFLAVYFKGKKDQRQKKDEK